MTRTELVLPAGALAIAICFTPFVAKAQGQTGQITGITVRPSTAIAGLPVTITVQGTGTCGNGVTIISGEIVPGTADPVYGVVWKDVPVEIDVDSQDESFPMSREWVYETPGIYHLLVRGSATCNGMKRLTFPVVERATQKLGNAIGSDRTSGFNAVAPSNPQRTSGVARRLDRSDSCKQGFVWREAVPSDHVCITPQMRNQVRADNASAAARRLAGADSCQQGFVWREAVPTDHVCVTPQTRAAVADDNRHAAERRMN